MHKMGAWGPKYYIFGDQSYSRNVRKLRFLIFPPPSSYQKTYDIIILPEVEGVYKKL